MRATRAAGDRDLAARIGALPKPSVAAWLVDLLAREEADRLQRVVELGAAFREAQAASDAPRLRELTAERRSLLGDVAEAARRLGEQAGQPASAAVLEEVQQTLQAAIVSEEAAAAVTSGRLVRTVSADGLEAVDLRGAIAGGAPAPAFGTPAPPPARRTSGDRDREQRREEAERRAAEAERRAHEARRAADEAERRARDAELEVRTRAEATDDLRRRLDELRARLDAAESGLDDARRGAVAARSTAVDAARAAEEARTAADRAADRLQELGG